MHATTRSFCRSSSVVMHLSSSLSTLGDGRTPTTSVVGSLAPLGSASSNQFDASRETSPRAACHPLDPPGQNWVLALQGPSFFWGSVPLSGGCHLHLNERGVNVIQPFVLAPIVCLGHFVEACDNAAKRL